MLSNHGEMQRAARLPHGLRRRPVMRAMRAPAPPDLHDPDSDAALVRACARGERRAAERLIRRHRGWVMRLAYSRLHNAAEAEDVTQDVFQRLWQKAAQWDGARGQFTTWLYTMVVNRCIDALRRRRPTAELEAADHVPDRAPSAAQQSEDAARRQILQAALQSLSAPQRAALELVYFAEWPQARAAAALGVSVEALESSLRRGRIRLRSLLADQKSALLVP